MFELHRKRLGLDVARFRLHTTLAQKRAAHLATRMRFFAGERSGSRRRGIGHGICRGGHLGRQISIIGIGRDERNRARFGRRPHHGLQLGFARLGGIEHALAFGSDLRNVDARYSLKLRRGIGQHGALLFGGLSRFLASFDGRFRFHAGHAQAQRHKVSVVFALQQTRSMTALSVERGLHAFQILQGVFFGGNDEFRHFALAFIGHIRTANFVHNEANRPCERGFLAQIGPRNNRTGSNARARHNGSARAKRRSKLRMRAALKHVNAVVERARIALTRRATHFARRHFFAHEFELVAQNINAHAAQRVVGNLALAHQIHTVAVCLHGNARRHRRFGGFFLKQLVDNILQNVDFHLRARRGAFAFFSGSQQRHHEIRDEQREHNNARCKEDEQVAVGKRRRCVNEVRKRHNDRKRHGALRTSKRDHCRVAQEIGVDLRTGALAIARELLHNHDPRETHAKHDSRNEHDQNEEPRAALTARRIPCRQNNLGKLHAQQHEHDAVNHEYDELPHIFAGHGVAR